MRRSGLCRLPRSRVLALQPMPGVAAGLQGLAARGRGLALDRHRRRPGTHRLPGTGHHGSSRRRSQTQPKPAHLILWPFPGGQGLGAAAAPGVAQQVHAAARDGPGACCRCWLLWSATPALCPCCCRRAWVGGGFDMQCGPRLSPCSPKISPAPVPATHNDPPPRPSRRARSGTASWWWGRRGRASPA